MKNINCETKLLTILFFSAMLFPSCSSDESNDLGDTGKDAFTKVDAGEDLVKLSDANDTTQNPIDIGPKDTSDTSESCNEERPWECILEEATGFGAATTGGAGGDLCWVENLNTSGDSSLADCLSKEGPTWVVFRVSGTITLNGNVKSNTTIDGRGQRINLEAGDGFIFRLLEPNVFLTHLNLVRSGNDLIHTNESATDVWLNHLTLTGGGDELLGLEASGGTVSWCHLHDAGYGMLIGGLTGKDYSYLHVTLHHNLMLENSERHPYTRGRVHSYNNYIDFIGSGARVSNDGQLLSENNIYKTETGNSGSALLSRAGGAITIPGFYRSKGDVTRGTASIDPTNDPTPVFSATDFYEYELDVADDALETQIRAEAGWQMTPLPMP